MTLVEFYGLLEPDTLVCLEVSEEGIVFDGLEHQFIRYLNSRCIGDLSVRVVGVTSIGAIYVLSEPDI